MHGVHALPSGVVHALPGAAAATAGVGAALPAGVSGATHHPPASMKPVVISVNPASGAATAHHPHAITGHFVQQQQQQQLHHPTQQQQQPHHHPHHHPPTLLDTQHQLLLQNKQSMALTQSAHSAHFQQLLSKRQLYAVSRILGASPQLCE